MAMNEGIAAQSLIFFECEGLLIQSLWQRRLHMIQGVRANPGTCGPEDFFSFQVDLLRIELEITGHKAKYVEGLGKECSE